MEVLKMVEQGSQPKRYISRMTTAATLILSGAAFAVGGVATFVTDNEVGTAAAYAAGLFFAVIGITGRVPKIKLGDNEIDPLSYNIGAVSGAGVTAQAVIAAAEESSDTRELVAAAESTFKEVADSVGRTAHPLTIEVRGTNYIDLDSGHWMAITATIGDDRLIQVEDVTMLRPGDLGSELLDVIARRRELVAVEPSGKETILDFG